MQEDWEIQDWADSILPKEIDGYIQLEIGERAQLGDIYISIGIYPDDARYGKWFRRI
jgi:hypothetical protein